MKRMLLSGAILLSLGFLMCHVVGGRECTSVLSGTYPSAGALGEFAILLGLMYAVAYMVVVILVPILILGAGIVWLFDRCMFGLRGWV